jgi:hypothetical protein
MAVQAELIPQWTLNLQSVPPDEDSQSCPIPAANPPKKPRNARKRITGISALLEMRLKDAMEYVAHGRFGPYHS